MIGSHRGIADLRADRTAAWLAAGALAAATGLLIADGRIAIATGLCLAGAIVAALGHDVRMVSIAVPILICGSLVLGYGFSNLAAFSVASAGIPISIVLLVACVPSVMRARPFPGFASRALLLLAVVGMVRLAIDVRHFGTLAVRDATWIGDAIAFFVGWVFVRKVGMSVWQKTLSVGFTLTAAYALAMTLRQGGGFGPTVGLLKPVSLLGSVSWYAIAGGLLFFLIVRPSRLATPAAAALGASVLLLQSRGLLVVIPAALGFVYLAARHQWGRDVRRRLVASTALLATVGVAVLFVAPSGRFGPTSGNALLSQLATLIGGTGPGSGSNASRFVFYETTFAQLRAHPEANLVGLGFGPDLAGGEAAGVSTNTRKPHNDLLEIYARMGMFALALYLSFLGSAVAEILRAACRSREAAPLLLWTAGVTFAFVALSLTQPGLAYPHFTLPLFLSLGAGMGIASAVMSPPGGASARRDALGHKTSGASRSGF